MEYPKTQDSPEPIRFTLKPLAPFRLDLTVWVLRRRPDNIVDRWDGSTYRRILTLSGRPVDVAVHQTGTPEEPLLHIATNTNESVSDTKALVSSALERMLGIEIDLTRFYRLAALDPKLEKLAGQFVGMKPPRFPTLFESLVNAIACQQVTLTLGIRLLNKLAVRYGLMAQRQDKPDHAFPTPEALAVADPDELRSMGLSRHKARALIELASALAENCLSLDQPTTMDDEAAVAFLSKIRGVGRWTAEYALLRGMGRIHIFPGDDVGARKNLERWLGMAEALDYEGVRRSIAPWKSYGGLIYFHLLLNRLQEAGYLQILKNRRNVMPTRSAEAVWSGTIREGSGRVKLGSGAYEGAYSFASRFEDAKGTNPEELIGAAHAGCFSMYLALVISKAGYTPARIRTTAKVHLGEGPRISRIDLDTEAEVAGLDEQTFSQYAADAKKNCPVSMALAGTEITLNAKLVS